MSVKILLVTSRYYEEISHNLYSGAIAELKKKNLQHHQIRVPGTFEIPFVIAKNIESYEAFIALGCLIKGETPHFEIIANAVTQTLINLSVNHKKPISNGIITCLNKDQAMERSDLSKRNKGGEAAKAVLSILELT